MPARILLKITIGSIENAWNVGRFSLLGERFGHVSRSAQGRTIRMKRLARLPTALTELPRPC
jgi:hypothetical protein